MIGRSDGDHFQRPNALVVIAQDLQQHIAARAGRKQNVVLFQQARIVRHQIFRLRGLELETSAHRARAATQIDQVQSRCRYGKRSDPRARPRLAVPAFKVTPLITASTSRNAFTRTFKPNVTSIELSRVRERSSCTWSPSFGTRDENLRERNVLLRVEIRDQLLVASAPDRRSRCAAPDRSGKTRRATTDVRAPTTGCEL